MSDDALHCLHKSMSHSPTALVVGVRATISWAKAYERRSPNPPLSLPLTFPQMTPIHCWVNWDSFSADSLSLNLHSLALLSNVLVTGLQFVHFTTFDAFKSCWISGKQCRPWSDATFCSVWSGSTPFSQASVPILKAVLNSAVGSSSECRSSGSQIWITVPPHTFYGD